MIGIFDSGLGGLTILKQVKKKLPQYQYIYLADSQYAPYGEKNQKTLHNRTKVIVDFFIKKGCKLIIVACNTVSAKALRKIQQELVKNNSEVKVLGVIIPTIEEIERLTKHDKSPCIGILATQSTVRTRKFPQEILNRISNAKVISKAAPKLVPIIETGTKDGLRELLEEYLKQLRSANYLILACTHFPILKQKIKRAINNYEIKIIDPSLVVAISLKKYLKNHQDVKEKLKKKNQVSFYSTKEQCGYKNKMEGIYGKPIKKLNIVKI